MNSSHTHTLFPSLDLCKSAQRKMFYTEGIVYTCYVSESNSRKDGVEVPDLLRYLSRNLIGPHWMLIRPFTISKVGPSETEGE